MVWTDTGGKQALFLGRRPHAYVVGLSADDSNQLLDEVWSHATNPSGHGTTSGRLVTSSCGRTIL